MPWVGSADMADAPFVSLYRRFRPGRFDEIKGQDHVVRVLRSAVRDDRVSHAYLFSGPRGTGKTSSARVLAKALNCEAPVEGEPCGVCTSCVEITRGNSLNVHELDAASNNGVDAMRDLVAHAGLGTPGRWKVYIVDEVHMLSTAAANALLKTLEEPPSHVVFVLATTDPQKVPPTIRSRTQHLEFRLFGAETLHDLLESVNDQAGLNLDEAAIEAAVRRGRGSARDALSALDQVVASGSSEAARPDLDALVDALADGDVGPVLVALSALMAGGWGPQQLATELIDDLRQVFLAALAPELSAASGASLQRFVALAEAMKLARVVRSIEILGHALIDMRDAPDAQVVLEIAVVRAVRPDLDSGVEALSERLSVLERSLSGSAAFPRPTATAPSAPAAPAPAPEASQPPPAEQPKGDAARRPSLGAVRRSKQAAKDPVTSDAPAPDAPATSDSAGRRRRSVGACRDAGRAAPKAPKAASRARRRRPRLAHRGVGRHHPQGSAGAGQGALQRRPLRLGGRRGGALRAAQRGAPRALRRDGAHRRAAALGALRHPREAGARRGRCRGACAVGPTPRHRHGGARRGARDGGGRPGRLRRRRPPHRGRPGVGGAGPAARGVPRSQ